MIGLLQRVTQASVEIDGVRVATIARGVLVLIGIERDDDETKGDRLAQRLLGYRVFEDAARRMNRSLRDVDGELLLVPQFTLAADTTQGLRPSFTPAAAPELARAVFAALVISAQSAWPKTVAGVFGADMQISLVNDGPVTFWLRV